MAADMSLAESANLTVRSWRIEEGALLLLFAGSSEERSLRCNCGRHHWIVETRHAEGRAILAVKCHGCGTTGTVPLAVGPAPLPG